MPATLPATGRSASARLLPGATAGLMLLAAALRFSGLARQSYWTDEGMSLYFSSRSLKFLLNNLSADYHPPAYFVLLNGWVKAFGTGEVAVRSLSALFSLAAVAVLLRLGRRLGGVRVGLFAALLAALSLYQVFYAQEARPYALLVLAGTAAMDAYLGFLRRPDLSRGLYLGAALLLCLATQYVGFFVVAVQNLHYLCCRFLPRRALPRPAPLPGLGRWLLVQGAVVLAFLPWLPVFLRQLQAVAGGFWMEEPTEGDLARIFLVLLCYRGEWLNAVVLASVAVAGTVLLGVLWPRLPVERPEDGPPRPLLLLLLWLPATVLAAYLLSRAGVRIFHPRSLSITAPALYLLLAWAADRLPGRVAGPALLGLALAVCTGAYGPYSTTTHKHDFRGAAAAVAAGAGPRDFFYFEPVIYKAAFDVYFDTGGRTLPPELPRNAAPTAPRVWCILKPRWKASETVREWYRSKGFEATEEHSFHLVDVVCFAR